MQLSDFIFLNIRTFLFWFTCFPNSTCSCPNYPGDLLLNFHLLKVYLLVSDIQKRFIRNSSNYKMILEVDAEEIKGKVS